MKQPRIPVNSVSKQTLTVEHTKQVKNLVGVKGPRSALTYRGARRNHGRVVHRTGNYKLPTGLAKS